MHRQEIADAVVAELKARGHEVTCSTTLVSMALHFVMNSALCKEIRRYVVSRDGILIPPDKSETKKILNYKYKPKE